MITSTVLCKVQLLLTSEFLFLVKFFFLSFKRIYILGEIRIYLEVDHDT